MSTVVVGRGSDISHLNRQKGPRDFIQRCNPNPTSAFLFLSPVQLRKSKPTEVFVRIGFGNSLAGIMEPGASGTVERPEHVKLQIRGSGPSFPAFGIVGGWGVTEPEDEGQGGSLQNAGSWRSTRVMIFG
jgi:hypothetical protein